VIVDLAAASVENLRGMRQAFADWATSRRWAVGSLDRSPDLAPEGGHGAIFHHQRRRKAPRPRAHVATAISMARCMKEVDIRARGALSFDSGRRGDGVFIGHLLGGFVDAELFEDSGLRWK